MNEVDLEELQNFFSWLEETYGPEEMLELASASIATLEARVREYEAQKDK